MVAWKAKKKAESWVGHWVACWVEQSVEMTVERSVAMRAASLALLKVVSVVTMVASLAKQMAVSRDNEKVLWSVDMSVRLVPLTVAMMDLVKAVLLVAEMEI